MATGRPASGWRANETRRWALFAPVALAAGVAGYFELSVEPHPAWSAAALLASLFGLAAGVAFKRFLIARVLAFGVALAALGFAAAQWRAYAVAAPVWDGGGERLVTARVLALEAASDGAPRLLIDQIEISGASAAETPDRARISFRALAAETSPADARARLRRLLGLKARFRARLFAPPGPAEPGGFDYRVRAWFERVGALGAASAWPEPLGAAAASGPLDRFARSVDHARRAIAERARAALVGPDGAPSEAGEIAAALLVGDRSGIPPDAVEALRISNLAHVLAISGLHMGIVCATVFWALRAILALPAAPPFGFAPKKLAALVALGVAVGYLLLAGAAVATQRAFIMAAVVFLAVLVDRPAVTLRAVAAAAVIILILRPESLYQVGFQLSFAATTAMVAVFEASAGWRRARRERLERRGAWRVQLGTVFSNLFIASLVAGLATAPFAAFAFNRLAPLGLIANLLATPALGAWIMPLGLLGALLTPLGLEGPAFAAMGLGIDYVVMVARVVADQPGAEFPVRAGPPIALALIAAGGVAICLWRSAALRVGGALLIFAALVAWRLEPRPTVLIGERGRLVGVLAEDGRAFNRTPTGRYAAELWLRRDGDRPAAAAERRAFLQFDGGAVARSAGGLRVEVTWGDSPDFEKLCAGPGVVIAPRAVARDARETLRGDCVLLDRPRLAGAVAIYEAPWRLVIAEERAGRRLWTGRAAAR